MAKFEKQLFVCSTSFIRALMTVVAKTKEPFIQPNNNAGDPNLK